MHKKMMKQEIKNDDLDHERGTEKKFFFLTDMVVYFS